MISPVTCGRGVLFACGRGHIFTPPPTTRAVKEYIVLIPQIHIITTQEIGKEMEEQQIKKKKPKGRIVVLIYQSYGVLMVSIGLIYNLLIRLDLVSTEMFSQAQLEQIKTASLIWLFFGLVAMLIRLIGAILLFMLRKAGFILLAMDAVIQSISLAVGIVRGFNAAGMEKLFSIGAVIVWGIAIAIAIYSWRLYSKGFLK